MLTFLLHSLIDVLLQNLFIFLGKFGMCVSYVCVLHFILPRELLSQNIGFREFLAQNEFSWDYIGMMN